MPGGFGDDSRHLNGLGADSGFGSPSSLSSPSDAGFGSVRELRDPGLRIAPWHFQHTLYPDEGGVLVRVMGAFPNRGPWRVRLTPDAGATLHPLGKVGCYGGIIGKAHACYTNPEQTALVFVLPPLAVGYYDVWMDELAPEDIAGGVVGPVRLVLGGLTVIVRNPCEETYSVRATYPPRFKTGVRAWELEDGTLPALPTPPLETFTRTLGQVAQQTGGSPQSRLALALVPDAAIIVVQSTIGFPDAGEVWVRERRYAYTSKTVVWFEGLTLLTADDRRTIPKLTEVTCHAPALLAG